MNQNKATETLKFLCSYCGKILLRHADSKLRYVGGHNRVLAVDRSVSFAELMVKLAEFCGFSVNLKCQLPNGDLETLVSITSDEDLANLIEEYDRASNSSSNLKIRAVLFPRKLLKTVSPPPSVDQSVDFSAVKSSRGYISRISSPVRFAVDLRRGSEKNCSYPCSVEGYHNKISHHHHHHHVPRCYYWQ